MCDSACHNLFKIFLGLSEIKKRKESAEDVYKWKEYRRKEKEVQERINNLVEMIGS